MDNKEEPILTIAIPTYNRGKIIYESVMEYLKIIPQEVEIIISDNGSEDETVQLLSTISDKRIKVYTNSENKGFTYNLLKSIKKSKGRFACIMSDEDCIQEEALKKILCYIKSLGQKEASTMAIIPETFDGAEDMDKTQQMLNVIYGRVSYMSGIIYNRKEMVESDFENINGIYPHIALLIRLGERGNIKFLSQPVVRKVREAEEGYIGGNRKQLPYIHPIERLQQLEEDIDTVISSQHVDLTKIALITKILNTKVIQGTVVYELIQKSEEIRKYFNLYEEDLDKDYLNDFMELYRRKMEYFLERNYNIDIQKIIEGTVAYINKVRTMRREYFDLINQGEYITVMLGSANYIANQLPSLQKYQYSIDYIATGSSVNINSGSIMRIDLAQLESIPKLILIVSSSEEDYIKYLYSLNLQEAHLFMIEDFRVYT